MTNRLVTLEELSQHDSEHSAWIAIDGKVYDVTVFLNDHPGGRKILLKECGKDGSKAFHKFHNGTASATPLSDTAKGRLVKLTRPFAPSAVESWESGGTADELPKERAKATFNVTALTNFLDGGAERTERRRYILRPLVQGTDMSDKYNMTRPELIRHHFEDFIGMHKGLIEEGFTPSRAEVAWMSEHAVNTGSLMPHMSLFLTTILGQASADQMGWWLWRTLTFQMIGSYAQTELGHGSNVRGLRTVATYDKSTEEFVLDTPTLQSMKWWNSNIGVAATHAAVFAQLVLDGKEYGVHVFLVQLRDENHEPLPGIEMGDVGEKMGDRAIDTGYLRLRGVRVPREHLFSKRQFVTKEGQYQKVGKEGSGGKLHYLTMVSARASMIYISGGKLAIAATIAMRYSCVRRQGFVGQNGSFRDQENQIIDYGMQQFRLFKWLSCAYAIKFVGHWMHGKFGEVDLTMTEGITDDEITEIHASSSGLKGLCTHMAATGIEDLRKACGGHGYLLNSGIASLAVDYVWQVTAEGDWIVMLLQTARYLVKCLGLAKVGKPLPGLTDYLSQVHSTLTPPTAATRADIISHDFLLALLRHRALVAVIDASAALDSEPDKEQAWNKHAVALCNAAKCHSFYFMFSKFAETVRTAQVEAPVRAVLADLCSVFGLQELLEGGQWAGIMDRRLSLLSQQAATELLDRLRPNAVALVDAFDYPDQVLNSTLGRYDGNVYDALYQGALASRLNWEQPFSGYKEFLQPHLDPEAMRLKNKSFSKL